MCPQAVADPEELERFAFELKEFSHILHENLTHLIGSYSRLGDTWQDEEYQKFTGQFEVTIRVLRRFLADCDDQVPFLQRKAQWIRQYQQQR